MRQPTRGQRSHFDTYRRRLRYNRSIVLGHSKVRQSGHCEIVRRISVTLAKLIFGRQTFVSVIVTTSIPMPFKLRHRAQATIVRRPMLLMIAALIALASGCATINPLHSVREKMAAGQYAAARQELL